MDIVVIVVKPVVKRVHVRVSVRPIAVHDVEHRLFGRVVECLRDVNCIFRKVAQHFVQTRLCVAVDQLFRAKTFWLTLLISSIICRVPMDDLTAVILAVTCRLYELVILRVFRGV